MKKLKCFYYGSTGLLFALLPCSSFGQALTGSSSAQDVGAALTINSSIIGLNIIGLNVQAGPVNNVSGLNPPYSVSSNVLTTQAAGFLGGLGSLNLAVDADSLIAQSDVNGGDGDRSTSATGVITDAGVGLTLPVLGNVLSLSVTGDGETAITSTSNVAFDGDAFTLSAAASSNFVDSGAAATLTLLGQNINLALDLESGLPTLIVLTPFDASLLGLGNVRVSGNIIVTPDAIDLYLDSITEKGISATALQVELDLTLAARAFITNIPLGNATITGDLFVNRTAAQSLAAVPEPGSFLLLGGTATLSLFYRRRRTS